MTRMGIESWWEITKAGLQQSIEVQAHAVEKACVHPTQIHEPFALRMSLLKGVWDVAEKENTLVIIKRDFYQLKGFKSFPSNMSHAYFPSRPSHLGYASWKYTPDIKAPKVPSRPRSPQAPARASASAPSSSSLPKPPKLTRSQKRDIRKSGGYWKALPPGTGYYRGCSGTAAYLLRHAEHEWGLTDDRSLHGQPLLDDLGAIDLDLFEKYMYVKVAKNTNDWGTRAEMLERIGDGCTQKPRF